MKLPLRRWGLLIPFGIGALLAIYQLLVQANQVQTPQQEEHHWEGVAPTHSNGSFSQTRRTYLVSVRNSSNYNKTEHQQQAAKTNSSTLALVDPRLAGGFRNQYIRLGGFIMHAIRTGIPNLLLESLQWDNSAFQVPPVRIPFDALFDVQGWNSVSEEVGTGVLPRLVPYSPHDHMDWDPSVQLFWNVSSSVSTDPAKLLRKVDLMKNTSGYKHPHAFGSSGIKNSNGRVWGLYQGLQAKRRPGDAFDRTDRAMARALRPSEALSHAVSQILHRQRPQQANKSNSSTPRGGLLVIHARCEIDMLAHRCSRHMVKKLAQILRMVEQSPHMNHGEVVSSGKQNGIPLNASHMTERKAPKDAQVKHSEV